MTNSIGRNGYLYLGKVALVANCQVYTMNSLAPGRDARSVPTYDFTEAATYLHLPRTTVRSWVCGQADFKALVVPASDDIPMLSFFNLVEIHVLSAIRRVHKIRMPSVRSALATLGRNEEPHPLLSKALLTDGVDLFARELGEIVNLSKPNQRIMAEVISAYLKRIEWEDDEPAILFPFTSANAVDGRRSVMIDPRIAFGRLVLSGTGIPTEIIFERFNAGESIQDIANDYRRDRLEIEDVVRLESARAA